MKNWSIRAKITLWFAAILLVMVGISIFTVLFVSNQVIQKTIRDGLVNTVERNVDEIEYYADLEEPQASADVNHFLSYAGGFLKIDDDFLDQVNEVYTALYQSSGGLLYGEDPVAGALAQLRFIDGQIQSVKINGLTYYVFDRELSRQGLEHLWLRGVVAETQGSQQISDISHLSLVVLPSLLFLALIGGYVIAGRMLRPVQKISDAAARIESGGDLKQRIQLGPGKDELHRLADRFNEMFSRLDKAFAAQRQFTSDASHELRTPAAVILAQCELSLEAERTPEEYADALRVIQRQGKRMSKLIGDMLDFARLEQQAESYTREPVDFSELVSDLCDDMALIGERGICLEHREISHVRVLGNRALLSRLLTNLISNAYRYGKENGHIWVELKAEGGEVVLTVADDGIGIPEAEQEKIFRRFYQVDSSRSNAGIGLGLSMAREIARFHGGTLTVQSGDGRTVFTLRLLSQ